MCKISNIAELTKLQSRVGGFLGEVSAFVSICSDDNCVLAIDSTAWSDEEALSCVSRTLAGFLVNSGSTCAGSVGVTKSANRSSLCIGVSLVFLLTAVRREREKIENIS